MDARTTAARLGELVIVDVREAHEWDAGHIEGARHLPLSQLEELHGDVPEDDEVVFVCRVGGRSATVRDWFRRQGYEADDLEGGMLAWADAGLPIVTDAGTPGIVADH
ncbi:MAG TPA: rhodanese-like domain-containing protein [Acidimicrobiales bacterium]|nr:rhodanese-like domain-containing protein [Acidimicrobiales bacterium]